MTEIFIQKSNDKREIALVEEDKLIEYYEENENSNRNEGNIYIGIVRDIIKGMEAAFVDIGTNKNSFIHLKDILPKVDETKTHEEQKLEITDVIKPKQKILVQVKKDSNSKKGARVSTHINLPSKYIVLMPNTDIITVSQKIEDKKEQQRLIKLVKNNLSEGNGAIIRTLAEGKEQEIIDDNISRIVVNSQAEKSRIEKMLNENKEYKNIKVELKKQKDILEIYDLRKQVEKSENRKVWLKCGGFITIDNTEALTAIDVNTGKFTGTNNDLQQTILRVNEEATIEIAKQLRLRDIGGIIIVDYIDMAKEQDKQNILALMKKELKNDRAKTQVEGFTKLDLMELTRKHICSHKE